jgi:hypothetical protein
VRLRQLRRLLDALRKTDCGYRFLIEDMVIGKDGIPKPEIDVNTW